MTIRLRYKTEIGVSASDAEDKDLGNHVWEQVTDALGDGGSRKTKLAAGASDVSVSLADIADAKFVAIRTYAVDPNDDPGTVEIKKNGVGGEVTEIVPFSDAKEGVFMVSTTGVTALYASNPGSVDMYIIVVAAGD